VIYEEANVQYREGKGVIYTWAHLQGGEGCDQYLGRHLQGE
jgi:hypothetical protein